MSEREQTSPNDRLPTVQMHEGEQVAQRFENNETFSENQMGHQPNQQVFNGP